MEGEAGIKLAVGSDERTDVTDWVVKELEARGISVELHGALKPGENTRLG